MLKSLKAVSNSFSCSRGSTFDWSNVINLFSLSC